MRFISDAEAREIRAAAAKAAGIAIGQMTGEARSTRFVAARAGFAVAMREAGLSTPRIGRLLGGRDHSTILVMTKNPVRWHARDEFQAALRVSRAAAEEILSHEKTHDPGAAGADPAEPGRGRSAGTVAAAAAAGDGDGARGLGGADRGGDGGAGCGAGPAGGGAGRDRAGAGGVLPGAPDGADERRQAPVGADRPGQGALAQEQCCPHCGRAWPDRMDQKAADQRLQKPAEDQRQRDEGSNRQTPGNGGRLAGSDDRVARDVRDQNGAGGDRERPAVGWQFDRQGNLIVRGPRAAIDRLRAQGLAGPEHADR